MKIQLIQKSNNYNVVTIGDLKLHFSYEGVIAFEKGDEVVISENVWTKMTGMHLNLINRNKKVRIDNAEFNARLQKLLKTI